MLPAQADEAKQAAFIAQLSPYERVAADEMVVLFGRCPPRTPEAAPPMAGFPRDKKTGLGRRLRPQRLNIQGALDLRTFQFTFVEGEKINAQTNQKQIAWQVERNNQTMNGPPCLCRQCRYHHAKILQPWLGTAQKRR